LLEKSDPIPTVLQGNLREQQSTTPAHADEQAMMPDLDSIRLNRNQGRKNAEGNLQFRKFFRADRTEPGIFRGGGSGGFDYCTVEWRYRKDISHAAPQVNAPIEGCKHSAEFGERRPRNLWKEGAIVDNRFNGSVCQPQ
jgi:hypothetical protein